MAYPYDGDPKRTRVLEAMKTTLEAIRQGSSYHHDLKQVHIYRGEELVLGGSMPAVVIVPDSSDQITGYLTCSAARHSWRLALVLSVRAGTRWREELEWLCSDVTVALEKNLQLGGEVVYAEIDTSDIFDLNPGDEVAQAQIVVAVEYRHALTNPTA
jgi:hypothetical protein